MIGLLTYCISLMMCQSVDDMKLQAQWDGAAGESRSRLLSDLSSKCLAV